MKNALEIRGLTRKYEGFALDNVNLTLLRGCVMGLVGENGAGKTTLIKTVLDLVRPDSGEIEVLGGRADDAAVRERIGAVLEDGGFLSTMNAAQVDTLLGRAYRAWDGAQFASYLDRFGIDRRKAIKDYSRGMKMKLSIAAALSHGAELLILDEATSGLDPVVRDEVLDLLYDFMQDETHAVLLSSHITSDLDKIADNIMICSTLTGSTGQFSGMPSRLTSASQPNALFRTARTASGSSAFSCSSVQRSTP